MEVTARLRHLQASPQKVRLVVDLIRGKMVGDARSILAFTPLHAARIVKKVLDSAVANAEQNAATCVSLPMFPELREVLVEHPGQLPGLGVAGTRVAPRGAGIEDVRRNWPFLRDRRIDAYGGITSRVLDDEPWGKGR